MKGLPDEEELKELEAELGSGTEVSDDEPQEEEEQEEEEETDTEGGDDSDPPAEEEPAEEEPWVPEKGETYSYRVNAKSDAHNCEVTKVVKTKQLVDLKRAKDGKTFPNIAWAKLEGEIV